MSWQVTIDLANGLTSTQGFMVQGKMNGGSSGRSVSGVGDFNGDGYSDVIIGAPYERLNGESNNRGISYVIFGGSSSFSTINLANFNSGTSGFIIQGAAVGDQSGWSVSGAGDINGDGYGDIIVGAPYASPNGRTYAGASYVIFGKTNSFSTIDLASFNSGTSGFIIQGAAAGDQSGWSVSGAGDVNNDGYDDIIIGSYKSSPNNRLYAGASYVIFGKASGFETIDLANSLNNTQGFMIQGAESGDNNGWSVSGAGDINADGCDDIIVGSPQASPNNRAQAGATYVIFGKISVFETIDLQNGLNKTQGFIIQGANYVVDSSTRTGYSVSSVRDINSDGFADIVIGTQTDSSYAKYMGENYVIFGKESDFEIIDLANGLNEKQGFVIRSEVIANQDSLYLVSGAGDINGDGFDDIIIGAPYEISSIAAGQSYSVFGKTTNFSDIELTDGLNSTQGFKISGISYSYNGRSVSEAGDINGDGYDDFVIGAPAASPNGISQAGVSYVIFGGPTIIIGSAKVTTLLATRAPEKFIGNGFLCTVSYVNSLQEVTVDLAAGYGFNSYAQRDVYLGIYNIVGSNYNDMIVGNKNDNVIEGKSGADILDGGDGNDTLSYVNSPVAVTIDLLTNSCSGGDAEGDTIKNFESILGSEYEDTLIGDNNINGIYGGSGNDIIEGKGDADTLDGGPGIDTLSYANSLAAVTVDLLTNSCSGGDAEGDIIRDFENVIGSEHEDTIVGDENDNIIEGKGGADVLDGRDGSDTLSYISSPVAVNINLATSVVGGGDAEGDIIRNFENILGSSYADTLIGDNNANNIYGKSGDDIIEGRSGADVLDGGDGNDTLSYVSSSAAVTVDLLTNSCSGGDAEEDIIINLENILGSEYADILIGDNNINIIWGGSGNDIIEGKGGADTLDGGSGIDTLSYRSSPIGVDINLSTEITSGGDAEGDTIRDFENVIGSEHEDTIVGDENDNIIEGKGGADTLDGGSGIDTLSYRSSPIGVDINLSTEITSGGDAEGDIIRDFENVIGSEHEDTIVGDENDNIIEGKDGADILDGGNGVDIISYESSLSAVIVNFSNNSCSGGDAEGDIFANFESIIGSRYDDILIGDSYSNYILGGAGSDIIEGRGGEDILDGGSGIDTLSYTTSLYTVMVNLHSNKSSYANGLAIDTVINFENVIGSKYNDTIIGNDNDNIIEGKYGADILDGKEGDDTLSYISSTFYVIINLFNNSCSGGDAEGDTFVNFENIIGSLYNDILIGDDNNNKMFGNAGNDIIEGKGGADILDGGVGIDTLSYISSASGVIINLLNNSCSGGDAERDIIINFENIIGSLYNDTLIGDDNDNIIEGKNGADVLDGRDGIDTLSYISSASGVIINLLNNSCSGGDAERDIIINFENIIGSLYNDTLIGDDNDNIIEGKSGADVLDGGDGIDTLSYISSASGVIINLLNNSCSGGDAERDIIINFENIIGSLYNDILIGNSGDNVIHGKGGDDLIQGAGGNDILYGEDGVDIFKITPSGTTIIKDFDITKEKLDFTLIASYYSLNQLVWQDNGNNTEMFILGGKVILMNVLESQLTESNFIFNEKTNNIDTKEISATYLSISFALVGIVTSLASTLYCFDKSLYCFVNKPSISTTIAITTIITASNFDQVFGAEMEEASYSENEIDNIMQYDVENFF